jgi:hypothetical protein
MATPWTSSTSAAFSIFLVVSVSGAPRAAGRALAPIAVPPDVVAGDGCYDAAGNLHLVLARDGACFYAVRPAGGTALEPGRPIPYYGDPLRFGGERRPRILVHPAGDLFVLWQAERGLHLAASRDRGRSWAEVPTAHLTGKAGIDVPNAAIGGDGALHLVWVDERDPALPDDEIAKHLYLASSRDGGRTFTAPRPITTDAARACPCCVPAIACGEAGEVRVAYRSSVANVKETSLLTSADGGRTFAERTLSDHRWLIQGCPMAGPSIGIAGPRIVLSWTSEGHMYTASSTDGGKTFTRPERLGRGRFNQVAGRRSGPILMTWDEGHQTGLWWSDDPRPAPRADITPRGVLIAGPDQRFDLLVPAPHGGPGHPR